MEKKTVSAIMLTLLFVSLLSLVLNVGIAYDSGTMSGKVTESDGVTPIVGALVEALQQGDLVVSSTTTGAGGIYSLPLPVGAYKLRVSANNRITATKPVVTVTADTTTTVDFKLSIGQMLVFDEFMGTSLNTSKWNSYLTGLGNIQFFNATSEPTKFSGFFVDSGYGGAGSAAITSKISATLDSTIIFEGRIMAYVEGSQGQTVYGDRQPRGLRVGTDENNAIEFRSASSSIEARTVASGVVTTTNYYVGTSILSWNWIYRIEANSSIVKFYVNGVLIATHTTNIPTGPLNIYMGTNYPGYGMVGVGADYLYLAQCAQAEVTFHQDGVGTDFTGTVLTVDGTGYTRTDLPKTFTWTIGTDHTFAYHSPLDVSAVKRYVWTHTLGLCTAQSGTITVPSEGGSVTGYYKTQYYLTVVSPYDTPGGMDWYDKDDTAYATLDYGIEDLAPGQRAVFTGWTGDASGTGLTSDPITMNAPKTATALWVIQWHLDVEVIPPEAGTIPGEDWYNNCTTVTLTADTYLPSEAGVGGVRYKFSYWDVDGTSVVGNSIDVHMDATHTATAHYTLQYYLTVKTDPAGIATIPGEGWYDPCTWVNLTAPFEPTVSYLFVKWTVNSVDQLLFQNVITVHIDGPTTATAVYKDYLGDAKGEIAGLKAYVKGLYDAGKIGKKEYEHFMKDLDKVVKDIDKAIKNLDKERVGYDDKMKGFEDLRHAVMKLEHMIKDVNDWAKKGKIPAANATWIITEVEAIRMKLVDKARAEALAERALALKAIEDAKAKGKDTTKAEKEIVKVDRELAKAEQKIAEGKLSQAIQHFKHAFAHSHHAIKKAYDPTWTIDYKDWIDELEEEDP